MKHLLFTIAALFFANIIFAQDIITQKNGEELEVKIIGISDNSVTYYYYNDPDKVEVTMNRSLIREIEYEYGRKEEEVRPGLDDSYFVDDKTNNILLNFTALAGNTGMISYEKGLTPQSSVGGGVKIHGIGTAPGFYDDKSGFGLEVNYKVKTGNLFKKSDYRPQHFLQGFYLRPDIGFTSAELSREAYNGGTESIDYSYFYGGFDIGKQWIFNNTLSLDLYTGLNFYGGSYEETRNGEVVNDDFFEILDGNMAGATNTAARYGLQIGFLFN